MRLDKFVADANICTRNEAAYLIKGGHISVDGKTEKKPDCKVSERSRVSLDGSPLLYREFIYIMMNKPAGVVSATDDIREKTVLSLLPEKYMTKGLFPAGRLDKDTVGLLILTNDGQNAHRLLSPKHHVEKLYNVECDGEFSEDEIEKCRAGIKISDDLTAKPCELIIDESDKHKAKIILTEGKYHEIKRICGYFGKKVVFLERESFGAITLDRSLERGSFRDLSEDEVKKLLESESIKK